MSPSTASAPASHAGEKTRNRRDGVAVVRYQVADLDRAMEGEDEEAARHQGEQQIENDEDLAHRSHDRPLRPCAATGAGRKLTSMDAPLVSANRVHFPRGRVGGD